MLPAFAMMISCSKPVVAAYIYIYRYRYCDLLDIQQFFSFFYTNMDRTNRGIYYDEDCRILYIIYMVTFPFEE